VDHASCRKFRSSFSLANDAYALLERYPVILGIGCLKAPECSLACSADIIRGGFGLKASTRYAGTDPLIGREIRFRKTCKSERAAQI
jgi:hypothetical protein